MQSIVLIIIIYLNQYLYIINSRKHWRQKYIEVDIYYLKKKMCSNLHFCYFILNTPYDRSLKEQSPDNLC